MKSIFSAVIIAKNERASIGKCLSFLSKVTDDMIVILDDQTTDDTASIAENMGARVILTPWKGYSANKNYGTSLAHYDWILCLDADEVPDQVLSDEIHNLVPSDNCYYEMNRLTWFQGSPVNHSGWSPDWVIRLYHKAFMSWNDNTVHEQLVSKHELKRIKLKGRLLHYSFRDEAHMKVKYDHYARLRAEEWKKSGKNPPLIKRLFGPYFRFFKTYIIKRGFLDGKVGFIIAKNEYLLKRMELIYFYKSDNKNA